MTRGAWRSDLPHPPPPAPIVILRFHTSKHLVPSHRCLLRATNSVSVACSAERKRSIGISCYSLLLQHSSICPQVSRRLTSTGSPLRLDHSLAHLLLRPRPHVYSSQQFPTTAALARAIKTPRSHAEITDSQNDRRICERRVSQPPLASRNPRYPTNTLPRRS